MASKRYFDVKAEGYHQRSQTGFWGRIKSKEMEFVLGEVEKSAPRSLLDVGCGPGIYAAKILQRLPGVRVMGVDSSQSMLTEFSRLGLPSIQCDLEQKVVFTEKFDLILVLGVLEFVRDLEQFLKSLETACAAKTKVIVLCPRHVPWNFLYMLFHLLYGGRVFLRPTNEYVDLFKDRGYNLIFRKKVSFVSEAFVFEFQQ